MATLEPQQQQQPSQPGAQSQPGTQAPPMSQQRQLRPAATHLLLANGGGGVVGGGGGGGVVGSGGGGGGGGDSREGGQNVTQLEFHQAMQDFKTMFPEMDEDVIEVILRANNGAVDSTIDQLLAMSTDNENERLRAELDATENAEVPPRYSPATPPPSYHQAVPYASQSPCHQPVQSPLQTPRRLPTRVSSCLVKEPFRKANPVAVPDLGPQTGLAAAATGGVSPLQTLHKWEPPLLGPLPHSFLRLDEHKLHSKPTHRRVERVTVLSSALLQQRMEENERRRRQVESGKGLSGGATAGGGPLPPGIGEGTLMRDPELAQYLEDERIAIFLQNEEFVQELRSNREFLTTLETDGAELPRKEDAEEEGEGDRTPGPLDAFPYTKNLPQEGDTDAAFKEKLKNMGKVSRRKFAQLARLFSRRKRRNFKQILSERGNPSRDNLLLYEDESSELSEEDAFKDDTWNSHVSVQNDSSMEQHRKGSSGKH